MFSSRRRMPRHRQRRCGMSWPKALVLRKRDMKLVSVSRKKLECHEGAYAGIVDNIAN